LIVDESGSAGLETDWLNTEIGELAQQETEAFFGGVSRVKNPSQAVLPVFFGKADLCVVTRARWEMLAELNPQVLQKMRVVAESDPLLTFVLGFRVGAKDAEKDRLLEELFGLHATKRGKQVLTMTRTKQIVPLQEEWLEGVRHLSKRHQALMSQPATLGSGGSEAPKKKGGGAS
jgi:ABC-type phosphate/phosphonate transport system substrate-binding protein